MTSKELDRVVTPSEEVKFLVDIGYPLFHILSNNSLLRTTTLCLEWSSFAVETNCHVELSNLVSILTRGWHFNRTRPVVVEEAETE